MLYGLNLLLCALAWYILQTGLTRLHGPDSLLARAIGRDWKGKSSPLLYMLGVVAAYCGHAYLGLAFFVLAALLWLVPDRRMERVLAEQERRDED